MTVAQAQAAYYNAYPNVPYIADTQTWFIWWNSWWQAHGGWPTIDLVAQDYPVDAQIMRAFGYISGVGIPASVLGTGAVTPTQLTAAQNALSPAGQSASATAAYNAQVAANNLAVSPDQTIFTIAAKTAPTGNAVTPSSGSSPTQLTNATGFGHTAVTPTITPPAADLLFGFPRTTVYLIAGAALLLILYLKNQGGKSSAHPHHA